MTNSEESRLDSVLRKGLRGIEGLPESARSADESITRYLRQRFEELLVSEYRRRSNGYEDEVAVKARTTQILDEVVLDAQRLYELFELQLKDQLDGFWEELSLEGKVGGAVGPGSSRGGAFIGSYSTGTGRTSMGGRRFYCTEGCEFEGELAYLAHRDRGHHPVPA
jgi:hypothetical protein